MKITEWAEGATGGIRFHFPFMGLLTPVYFEKRGNNSRVSPCKRGHIVLEYSLTEGLKETSELFGYPGRGGGY